MIPPLQTLFNKDYLFYSGSVVNNPHGYGIHMFAGANPPTTFHWRERRERAHPPFVNASEVVNIYYGKNVYDQVRSSQSPMPCVQWKSPRTFWIPGSV